jgi:hypothetical protein
MTNEQWTNVLSRAGAVLNFGIAKKEQLQNNNLAKLITATPYLADCMKATETSFSNLLIYLMSLEESAKDIYFHKTEDDKDLYSRLAPISNFIGGNKTIIQCSLDLTALCMLSNYRKDADLDMEIGKYNPINSGKWNYDELSATLIENIDKTIIPDMADIYTKENALRGMWRG